MILPSPHWSKAPGHLRLLSGEVHLWRANLFDFIRLDECFSVLSRDEILRAERFVFEKDRSEYILSHGALRMVLARYLSSDPREIQFTPDLHGKPGIVQQFTDIRFNLSHSTGLALIAVARGREVGVDVERVDDSIHYEEIANHFFDPHETWDLRTAPQCERTSRFFDVWTRKEARLKAIGVGLTGRDETDGKYAVHNLTPATGFAGAIASKGEDWHLAYWDWS